MSPRNDSAVIAYGGMHWSEAEIMAMEVSRRRFYVRWVEEQLRREREAADAK